MQRLDGSSHRSADQTLRGKVCVVTGASRGIGLAIAMALAAQGADLLLCARGLDELEATAQTIRDHFGVSAYVACVDLCGDDAGDALSKILDAHFGRLDGLVNNVGQLGPVGTIDKVDLRAWASTLLLNVAGTARVIAALVPVMAKSGGGSIVNLSGAGIGGPSVPPRVSAYTASKAALVSLTETLAAELHSSQIRVNAIAPGPVATGFLRPVLSAGPMRAGDDLYRAAIAEDLPSLPSDQFLAWLTFLVSNESSWLTGRLVSARWDEMHDLQSRRDRVVSSSLYTVRRIDDVLFTTVTSPFPDADREG